VLTLTVTVILVKTQQPEEEKPMSGHSKWATIRRKKEKTDAARGRLFTKLIREIAAAARIGGGDPAGNPRLRTAVDAARSANMPSENIERAIKKGTGELPGTHYEEMIFEGYGPGGVAILLETLTDNKNRTTAEVRHIFSKYGGRLGEAGCVSWMFEQKGLVAVPKSTCSEDDLLALVMDAGAEDLRSDDEDVFEIISDPSDLERIKDTLEGAGLSWDRAELTRVPQRLVPVDEKNAEQLLRLMSFLEDQEDVQHTFANFDIPEEVLERV
jgi:YebC/PmpR family DNA-binding regulatory protein